MDAPFAAAPHALPPCVVGPGGHFEGLFSFRGAARLEGRVEGDVVASGTLWVGESARLQARIEVDELVVAGSIEGDIEARRRVELLPTARVRGTIRTQKLSVAEGARFEGRLAMGEAGRRGA